MSDEICPDESEHGTRRYRPEAERGVPADWTQSEFFREWLRLAREGSMRRDA